MTWLKMLTRAGRTLLFAIVRVVTFVNGYVPRCLLFLPWSAWAAGCSDVGTRLGLCSGLTVAGD